MLRFRSRICFSDSLAVSRIPAAGLWALDKATMSLEDDCSGFGQGSIVFAVEPIAHEARSDSPGRMRTWTLANSR
jgi:hypothetical protein